MNIQQPPKNHINTLLIFFVLGNIAMGVVNIALWIGIPSLQSSLQGGPIAKTFGFQNGLAIGTALLSTVSIIYATALFGLSKKLKWAPILIIAISIANRIFALVIFEFTVPIFYVWTGILVFAALLDYRSLSKPPKPLPQSGYMGL